METPERLDFHRVTVPSPSTAQSSSSTRLWRPAAQRNLRNQWSKLVACSQRWAAASSNGRSQATCLVNAYLFQIYMPAICLGVLSDSPNIRKKMLGKLSKQLELHRCKLLMTYKYLVYIVLDMIDISKSMRCYIKGATSSPLAQFFNYSNSTDDVGDGGGIPVYHNWNIPQFELLADELTQMFKMELDTKVNASRLVVELLAIISKSSSVANAVSCSTGESVDLSRCNLDSIETNQISETNCRSSNNKTTKVDGESVLKDMEVCLTVWLSEVYLDVDRLDEIFNVAGLEMQVNLK